MKAEAYRSDEMHYAYCCHVFYRWQSRWRRPNRYFPQIRPAEIEAERPGIRILNVEADGVELALLASSKKAAEAVADAWGRQLNRQRVQLCRLSFVPDHVHLAIRTHPSVVPAELVVELLNSSQQLMFQAFDELVIATGNRRLWKPSAYVGTYGDLSNRQVQAYLRNWRNGSTNQLAGPRQPT
jgi:REP element-mobilizing transposase RayT